VLCWVAAWVYEVDVRVGMITRIECVGWNDKIRGCIVMTRNYYLSFRCSDEVK
jgi:hypothetical protein